MKDVKIGVVVDGFAPAPAELPQAYELKPEDMRGVTTDMVFMDDRQVFDDMVAKADEAKLETLKLHAAFFKSELGEPMVTGVDLASEPSESRHVLMHPDGCTELLTRAEADALCSEPVSGPSCIQCLCCVAGGDDTKKVCEFRNDTGIKEGWYCEECYRDWKNTPE